MIKEPKKEITDEDVNQYLLVKDVGVITLQSWYYAIPIWWFRYWNKLSSNLYKLSSCRKCARIN